MRSLLRRAVDRAVANEGAWRFLDETLLKACRYAERRRNALVRGKVEESQRALVARAISTITPDLVVRHGPFRGLTYPEAAAFGSCLFPVLLGSYERELHSAVERLCREKYDRIVDIGCAEGYYAVGLAMRVPTAHVFAFDTNPAAVDFCGRMAEKNGVDNRMTLGGFCDAETLRHASGDGSCLIVSDCEGYERELFIASDTSALRRCHVLIETHDFIHPGIAQRLRETFGPTHDIDTVYSLNDSEKARLYDFEELRAFDKAERGRLLAETRPETMEWLIMTPRKTP